MYAGPQSYVIQIRSASYVTRAVHCEQPSSSPTSIQFGGAASMAASCKCLALVPVRSFSGNNTTWGEPTATGDSNITIRQANLGYCGKND